MQSYSLKVVGTGSGGNCYLLTVNGQTLVIEAGVNFKSVKKALNFDLSGVVGVLVSHEHGDHADFVKDFVKFGKKVYTTNGVGKCLKLKNNKVLTLKSHISDDLERIEDRFYKIWRGFNLLSDKEKSELVIKYGLLEYNTIEIGIFSITPFEIFHDAKEPCGFLIEFEGKRLAFITDTNDLNIRLNNIDYWLIEANYSPEKLRTSSLDVSLKKRIQQSHMSIDRCKKILEAHNAEKSKLVLLIHGSEKHSNKEEFLTKIPYAVIASNGLNIEL